MYSNSNIKLSNIHRSILLSGAGGGADLNLFFGGKGGSNSFIHLLDINMLYYLLLPLDERMSNVKLQICRACRNSRECLTYVMDNGLIPVV